MKGLALSEGIAIGKAWIVSHETVDDRPWPELSVQESEARFGQTLQALRATLQSRIESAEGKVRKAQAEIFEAHRMMAEDPEMESGVLDRLQQGDSLPAAVASVLDRFAAMMEAMDNPYFQQRAQDYRDIKGQLLGILLGDADHYPAPGSGEWILISDDFTPSEIALTENPAVKGFLSREGAATTHFAILARIAGVPTVARCEGAMDLARETTVILDGSTGDVLADPAPEILERYRQKQQEQQRQAEQRALLKDAETVTPDGYRCTLEGNIAGPQDVAPMLENGAEGVGLFRTEFIYLDRESAPGEEEQAAIYRQVLAGMAPRPVVIRTLDVGGDKELPYLGIEKEENPFLGFRAVRYCLKHPELFKTQLRALLRASVSGNLHIMVPMISGIEEVRQTRALLAECRQELEAEGVPMADNVPLGIMMEVPSAAVTADLLAQETDFFSIGTNDLIQYVLAADRMNKAVSELYTPCHPAFLRVLRQIIEGAHGGGIEAALCGELASDLVFTPVLLGMGLDVFSMNARSVLKVRERIRSLKHSDCTALVEHLLTLRTGEEIKRALKAFNEEHGHGNG